jgi:release factor glutamine methyltransferase
VFIDRICAGAAEHLAAGGVMLPVHSSVCDAAQTLSRLREQGLQTEVVYRHRGELGPILRSRQEWSRERGLLLEDGREEMLVIRRPGADRVRAADTCRTARPANRG